MIVEPRQIQVTYRYVIDMPDATELLPRLLRKWSMERFNDIYNGKYLLLINPIFKLRGKHGTLFQILFDIDAPLTKSLPFARQMMELFPDWFIAEYAGKNGIHLASKFLVYSERVLTPKQIHVLLYRTIRVRNPILDWKSSTRNMATVRIGYRKETDRMAFPIPKNRMTQGWISTHAKQDNFSTIMSMLTLKKYIQHYLIPFENQITVKEFITRALQLQRNVRRQKLGAKQQ